MKILTKNDLLENIYANIIDNKDLNNFKLIKSKNCFQRKNSDGFDKIVFQIWDDVVENEKGLIIEPLYLKRFDVLHTWQNKYSFKTLTDQRNNPSIFVGGNYFDKPNYYFINQKKTDLRELEKIISHIKDSSIHFFSKFKSLNNLYEFSINPIINDHKDFPSHGADWIFEMLILCKIVNPKTYPILKKRILIHIDYMKSYNEPNIMMYNDSIYSIIEEISI